MKGDTVRFTCGISLLFTVAAGRPRRHFSLWVLPLWSKYYCWRLHKWAGTEIPPGLQESAISCAFFVCRRKQIEVNHSSNTSGCCCCCCMLPCDLTDCLLLLFQVVLWDISAHVSVLQATDKKVSDDNNRFVGIPTLCECVFPFYQKRLLRSNGQCNNAVTTFQHACHPLCPHHPAPFCFACFYDSGTAASILFLFDFPLAHPPYLPRVHCPYLLVILESTASAHILQLLHKPSTLPHRREHAGKSDHFPPSCLQCKQRHSYLLTAFHVAPVANLSEKLSWNPAV